tara:strand:- start:20 stop:376 length:357 start_codon:yes stop_codon:yes gene_type:complete
MNNPLNYLFIITHLNPGIARGLEPDFSTDGLCESAGRFGRHQGQPGYGRYFRLRDDRGNIFARGQIWDNGSTDQALAPLDYAISKSWGATTIDVWEPQPDLPDCQWGWSTIFQLKAVL